MKQVIMKDRIYWSGKSAAVLSAIKALLACHKTVGDVISHYLGHLRQHL